MINESVMKMAVSVILKIMKAISENDLITMKSVMKSINSEEKANERKWPKYLEEKANVSISKKKAMIYLMIINNRNNGRNIHRY